MNLIEHTGETAASELIVIRWRALAACSIRRPDWTIQED